LITSLPTLAPQKMSELRKTSKLYILNIINSDSSQEHSENSTKYVENIDKDIILLSADSGQQT
jgi:hypothetical protein